MTARAPGRARRARSLARGDIPPAPRPGTTPQGWADEAQAIELLRAWAEDRATEAIEWYLRDKQPKRWASRLLRAAAVLFAVTGGVLPLISGSIHGINPDLGYVSLAIAAGCVAFDHFFGLSSGWIRDITAIQALQGLLARFHLDWARWQATQAGAVTSHDDPTSGTTTALDLITGLIADVTSVTEAETAQWIADFTTSIAALRHDASPSITSPQDLITWSSKSEPAAG